MTSNDVSCQSLFAPTATTKNENTRQKQSKIPAEPPKLHFQHNYNIALLSSLPLCTEEATILPTFSIHPSLSLSSPTSTQQHARFDWFDSRSQRLEKPAASTWQVEQWIWLRLFLLGMVVKWHKQNCTYSGWIYASCQSASHQCQNDVYYYYYYYCRKCIAAQDYYSAMLHVQALKARRHKARMICCEICYHRHSTHAMLHYTHMFSKLNFNAFSRVLLIPTSARWIPSTAVPYLFIHYTIDPFI